MNLTFRVKVNSRADCRFVSGDSAMIRYILAATIASGLLAVIPSEARAAACAYGIYRAGCAGPNGAAVVRTPDRDPFARAAPMN